MHAYRLIGVFAAARDCAFARDVLQVGARTDRQTYRQTPRGGGDVLQVCFVKCGVQRGLNLSAWISVQIAPDAHTCGLLHTILMVDSV